MKSHVSAGFYRTVVVQKKCLQVQVRHVIFLHSARSTKVLGEARRLPPAAPAIRHLCQPFVTAHNKYLYSTVQAQYNQEQVRGASVIVLSHGVSQSS